MKKKQVPDTIYIGKRQLGWRMVDYYLDPKAEGAWCQACPGTGEDSLIHIGLNRPNFAEVIELILHEGIEFLLNDLNASFKRKNAYVDNASDCGFFMYDHLTHTEVCGRMAGFLVQVINETQEAYQKYYPTPK